MGKTKKNWVGTMVIRKNEFLDEATEQEMQEPQD